MRLVTEQGDKGCLSINSIQPDGRSVKDHLLDKHPNGNPAHPSSITTLQPVEEPHHVIFEEIDGPKVKSAIFRLSGSAGPSGLDARGWKRLCSSFHRVSSDLCESIAQMAKRLCTSYVDPSGLAPLIACRLIALDKSPGVRPIGVGEVLRRLIAKVVLKVAHEDIKKITGSHQLCAGHEAACDSSVHAITKVFELENTEAVLLVDASNAFNSLNRQSALKNTQILCPILAPILINTYRSNARLYIDGTYIESKEGTTQGDPLAMTMYAIGTLPLIHQLQTHEVIQSWYADDSASGGRLSNLKEWWKHLQEIGPHFGYHPNPKKSWLVVKPHHMESAETIFEDTGLNITKNGQKYLGGFIGCRSSIEEFSRNKVSDWVSELMNLSVIAESQPQAAYTLFTHCLSNSWNYIMRILPDIDVLLQPLEDSIRQHFLPALIGRSSFSDAERELLALPTRHGGLGIVNPTKIARNQYNASCKITAPMVSLLCNKDLEYSDSTGIEQKQIKDTIHKCNRTMIYDHARQVVKTLPQFQQLAIEQASEKGASSWLTTIPIKEHGFNLHKQAFRDAICLRYGWRPPRLPPKCACGAVFSVSHAFSCSRGAFPSIRHNRIRDLLAQLITEVCPNVAVEPTLQPITNETFPYRGTNVDDGARLDIKAQNFWDNSKSATYFDVRVFNPHAASNCKSTTAACYRKHELEKKRQYERRVIDVEHGTFTPLIFSSSGGWSPSTTVALRRLADLLAKKHSQSYATTMGLLRCRVNYSLLDSAIMCLRGARSSSQLPINANQNCPPDLIVCEAQVPT